MSDEPNMQYHREKNYRDLYPVSPSFPRGAQCDRGTEAEYRASKPLSMLEVIKRAAEKKDDKK